MRFMILLLMMISTAAVAGKRHFQLPEEGLASAVDPGPREGASGAGGPIANLTAEELLLFLQSERRNSPKQKA